MFLFLPDMIKNGRCSRGKLAVHRDPCEHQPTREASLEIDFILRNIYRNYMVGS